MKSFEINFQEILSILPHRYPFLLIDKVRAIELGKSIEGVKNVTCNEPHFTGHFPDIPVMPGVLIIEAMAQVSAILIAKTSNLKSQGKLIYLTSIDECKFRKVVVPGDVLILRTEISQNRSDMWKFKGLSLVDDKVVAEANFSAMVKNRDF